MSRSVLMIWGAAVSVSMEEMEERTSQQQHVGQNPDDVAPMLSQHVERSHQQS